MKNIDTLCIGEVLWDKLPDSTKPGGAPLNVAINLKKLGAKPAIISRIGNDSSGKNMINFLKQVSLNYDYIQVDEKYKTSRVLVHLKGNDVEYEICEPVAWDNIQYNTSVENLSEKAKVIIYGTLASRSEITRTTIQKVLESRAYKVLDVNLRPPYDTQEIVKPLLHSADLVKLNIEELLLIASWYKRDEKNENELITWFSKTFDCPTVCVSKADKGATLFRNNQFYEHKGFKVQAADPVGAGDAFLAGMVYSLILNESTPEDAIAFACATGAFVASQTGANPHYNLTSIFNLINQQKS